MGRPPKYRVTRGQGNEDDSQRKKNFARFAQCRSKTYYTSASKHKHTTDTNTSTRRPSKGTELLPAGHVPGPFCSQLGLKKARYDPWFKTDLSKIPAVNTQFQHQMRWSDKEAILKNRLRHTRTQCIHTDTWHLLTSFETGRTLWQPWNWHQVEGNNVEDIKLAPNRGNRLSQRWNAGKRPSASKNYYWVEKPVKQKAILSTDDSADLVPIHRTEKAM